MIQTKTIADDTIRSVVTSSRNRAEAARSLGMAERTLAEHMKRLTLRTAHTTRNKRCLTADDVRVEYLSNKNAIDSTTLRKLLLNTGIKQYRCELCGLTTWLEKPIPLQLHHRNSNHHDNTETNLMLVCPTCHVYIEQQLKLDKTYQDMLKHQKQQELKDFYKKYGAPPEAIHSKKFTCTSSEMISLFKLYKSYTAVGNYFGVTDKAVKKRCERLGILEQINPIIKAHQKEIALKNKGQMTAEKRELLKNKLAEIRANRTTRKVGMFAGDSMIKLYENAAEAIKDGFSDTHIRECCRGIRKSHKGYLWRYID